MIQDIEENGSPTGTSKHEGQAGSSMVDDEGSKDAKPLGVVARPNDETNADSEELNLAQDADFVDPLEVMRKDIEKLQGDTAKAKDAHLRTLAEMENLRKRQKREMEDFHKFASENILRDLLPILDSFDKAIHDQGQQNSHGGDGNAVFEGFAMIHKQMIDALIRHGLSEVSSVGTFDPNIHQAIQRIEKDGLCEEQIGEVFAKGYLLHGRLLRAAMVSVEVPKSDS